LPEDRIIQRVITDLRVLIERSVTADVAPKSEVESFNKSKGGFCPLCGSYTITQGMMEKLRMAHKEQGQHGDPVGEKGVNALKAIKSEVAREIFEEIECTFSPEFFYNGRAVKGYLAELKKKYTEVEP
jgi:hypothetical protein